MGTGPDVTTPSETRTPVRWNTRGVGLDMTPGCFVCGTTCREEGANEYMHNVAALIAKRDEDAALACFEQGARMGYYHADRECPQIKVGACTAHLPELRHLGEQWFISADHVARVALYGRRRTEREAASNQEPGDKA